MSINLVKTVELVFCRPKVLHDILPPALPDINRMCVMQSCSESTSVMILISNPGHLVPSLRQRGHNFILPNITYEFNKCHFIACFLFDYVLNFVRLF